MLPIIIHTSSFYNFTTSIIGEPIPFSDLRRFWDFSSLVEAFVLSDELLYWNTGAYAFEWSGGYYTIPGNHPSMHPYEIFHGFDFLNETPFNFDQKENRLVELVDQKIGVAVLQGMLREEPYHPYTVWSSLNLYVQAYNGNFGDVCVFEPAVIKDVLPHLVSYQGSSGVIANDPLIFKGYEILKKKYSEKLAPLIISNGLLEYSIPPITAILLSRLPDNCTNPSIAIRHMVELREELEPVRRRYSEMEDALYNKDATLKDLLGIRSSLLTDSSQLDKRFGVGFYENAAVRWFADKFSFVVKVLTKQGVELDEIRDLIGDAVAPLTERITCRAPSRLYHLAMDTQNIKGYSTLAKRKLNFDLK